MKTIFIILFLCSFCNALRAQLQNAEPDEKEEQHLENISESTETESEDEYYFQQLVFYKLHPLNINAPESDLNEFPFFEPLQIENLIKYRTFLGNLISVYELQSVRGFGVDLIKKILPYITIADRQWSADGIAQRFRTGDRMLTVRPSVVPEKAKGFNAASSPAARFQGGRLRVLARYKYQYRDLLQYGIVADQDAGEKFVFGNGQAGFDFYSVHLFARKLGPIKALALGDYTVNLGQGLIQWQSLAYNKSSEVINIKRQSEVLRPYCSAGEYNFFRGIGLSLERGNFEHTLFLSHRKLSANIDIDDQLGKDITSVQTSGLHRTLSEIEHRNTASMNIIGANIKWQRKGGHFGINAVRYEYSLPLLKRNLPYNLYAIKGKVWGGYSADYSVTYRNYHFFGEMAVDKQFHPAFISGLMTSLSGSIGMALLFRSIGRAYQSLFGNAFTENTMPSNENGIYAGISFKPTAEWRIDVYADLFRFPWLRYRADAPGYGCEYFIQADWKPNKKVEIYSKVRSRIKPLNEAHAVYAFHYPQDMVHRNWRTHISYQLSKNLLLRNRFEFCWFGNNGEQFPETGFLMYADILYKPFGKPFSVSARFQVFETGGYDTRMYAYENDVLFTNSSPAFFDKGSRIYLNLKSKVNFDILRGFDIDLGLKAATSLYSGKASIGSGQDEITGSHKSEIRVQVFFSSA